MGSPLVGVVELIVGAVLSTVKVVLLPETGAVLPAMSMAVPATIVMPNEPSPTILLIVTVRELPEPDSTPTVPFAVPDLFNAISPTVNVLALKFIST